MLDLTLINLNHVGGKMHMPIGCLRLIASLNEAGFKVDFRDFQSFDYENAGESILKGIAQFMGEGSANVIGISCMSNWLPQAILASKIVKELAPDKKIILGGIGPSVCAQELMEAYPHIDLIVRGEAEITFVELMQSLSHEKSLSGIKGLVYRQGNKILINPPRPRISELDKLPLPAYDAIDLKKYNVIIESSRGCVFNCSFCSVNQYWGHYNTRRSIENIFNEIRILTGEYGVKRIEIGDDCFTLDKNYVRDFCDTVKKEKLDFNWRCNARTEAMTKDLVQTMSQGNCLSVFLGIESASPQILRQINKQFTIEQADRAIANALKYFSRPSTCSFIFGFPFESMSDFNKTLLYMINVNNHGAKTQLHLLTPFANSAIYEKYKSCLKFAPNIVSDLIAHVKDEWVSEIEKYPNLYSGFYFYWHDTFYRKIEILNELYKKIEL